MGGVAVESVPFQEPVGFLRGHEADRCGIRLDGLSILPSGDFYGTPEEAMEAAGASYLV